MHRNKSFARFVSAPENLAAFVAMKDLAAELGADRLPRTPNPLYLHGSSGTGKSHLVSALAREVTKRNHGLIVNMLEAEALTRESAADSGDTLLDRAKTADLLIVEDLQHLPLARADALAETLDYRLVRGLPTVLTASVGPQQLGHRGVRFPNRLTSRLVAGLVVQLQPLQAPSRLTFLEEQSQRRQLPLTRDVLTWLSEHVTGGGRQLEGALHGLQQLGKLERTLDLATVVRHLQEHAEAGRPTVERIALRVSGYFRVEARHLQSRRRYRNILVPRQVGMYLARKLTGLSLEQIGAYFGGRDHSTVLHACRKVERAIKRDAVLSGAIRQLHADLA